MSEVSLPVSARSGVGVSGDGGRGRGDVHRDWLRTRGDLYDWSTRTRLESASVAPASAYLRGLRARTLIRDELMAVLEEHDVIAMPASPTLAPPIAQSTGEPGGYYQGRLDLGRRRYTSPAALAGLPAISVPCGLSSAGCRLGCS